MATWDRETLALALGEREVDLTTWGRRTGNPARVTIWIWGDGERLFIRSGRGLGRDWPRNILARGRGLLHLAGRDIPVRARHVTDPAEARWCSGLVKAKYGDATTVPAGDDPPSPGEQATFELTPVRDGS